MDDYPVENWTPPENFWDDPVAREIKWTPCSTDINEEPARVLVNRGSSRVEFRATRYQLIGWGCGMPFFFTPLLLSGLFGLGCFWLSPEDSLFTKLLMTGLGLVFVPVSSFILYWSIRKALFLRKPIFFDLNEGYFITKDKESDSVRRKQWRKFHKRFGDIPLAPPRLDQPGAHHGAIDQIHAIQVLDNPIGSRFRKGLELNVVLASGNRINLLHHQDKPHLRETSKILADFLGVPLWDDSQRGNWKFVPNITLDDMWHADELPDIKELPSMGSWVWTPKGT